MDRFKTCILPDSHKIIFLGSPEEKLKIRNSLFPDEYSTSSEVNPMANVYLAPERYPEQIVVWDFNDNPAYKKAIKLFDSPDSITILIEKFRNIDDAKKIIEINTNSEKTFFFVFVSEDSIPADVKNYFGGVQNILFISDIEKDVVSLKSALILKLKDKKRSYDSVEEKRGCFGLLEKLRRNGPFDNLFDQIEEKDRRHLERLHQDSAILYFPEHKVLLNNPIPLINAMSSLFSLDPLPESWIEFHESKSTKNGHWTTELINYLLDKKNYRRADTRKIISILEKLKILYPFETYRGGGYLCYFFHPEKVVEYRNDTIVYEHSGEKKFEKYDFLEKFSVFMVVLVKNYLSIAWSNCYFGNNFIYLEVSDFGITFKFSKATLELVIGFDPYHRKYPRFKHNEKEMKVVAKSYIPRLLELIISFFDFDMKLRVSEGATGCAKYHRKFVEKK